MEAKYLGKFKKDINQHFNKYGDRTFNFMDQLSHALYNSNLPEEVRDKFRCLF